MRPAVVQFRNRAQCLVFWSADVLESSTGKDCRFEKEGTMEVGCGGALRGSLMEHFHSSAPSQAIKSNHIISETSLTLSSLFYLDLMKFA